MSNPTLSIATWNVNSVRARLEHLLKWIDSGTAPDVILLQELKTENDSFPAMEIEERGYNIAIHGQKSYNGVGILSKYPLEDVVRSISGNESDEQARYIEALVSAHGQVVRVASVYVPNGNEVGSEKFAYKLRFLNLLHQHMAMLLKQDELVVIGGDYNVAPFPLDVFDPKSLDGTVCYHPQERALLRRLMHLGYYDAWRALHPETQAFSWWDYRSSGWKMNKGMRIDHLLMSPRAMDQTQSCVIESQMRDAERASDHAPVVGTLRLRAHSGLFEAA